MLYNVSLISTVDSSMLGKKQNKKTNKQANKQTNKSLFPVGDGQET